MAYNPRKAAQMIAFFILKSGTNVLDVVKAVKLVYMADRKSLQKFGFPILDEVRVSMMHGPVSSDTYRRINGEVDLAAEGWANFLSDKANHRIALARPNIVEDDLDELSDDDIAVMNEVWAELGHMGKWQIRDWTHDPRNVPEWEDPGTTSREIPLRRILELVGHPDPVGQEATILEAQRADCVFASLRG